MQLLQLQQFESGSSVDNVLHVSHLGFFNAAPAVPAVQVKASLAPEIPPGNQPQGSPAVLVRGCLLFCQKNVSYWIMWTSLKVSWSQMQLNTLLIAEIQVLLQRAYSALVCVLSTYLDNFLGFKGTKHE